MLAALALLLSVGSSGAGTSDACGLTRAEKLEVRATTNRAVGRPSPPRLRQFERYPRVACGVWRVEIGPKGDVRVLRLVRSGGERAQTLQLEPWLRTIRYRPAPRPWSGLVSVRLNEEQDR